MKKKQYLCGVKKMFCIVVMVMGLLLSMTAEADVIRLKSGKKIEGTILLQNEEVVIIREESTGKRYQYPISDIDVTEAEDNSERPEQPVSEQADAAEVNAVEYKAPKVSIMLSVSGGGAAMSKSLINENSLMGANAGGDFAVGTYNMLKRKIFFGAGIGYHAYILDGKTYSFLPVQLRMEVPLMQSKHAPLLGLGAGYGIGLQGVTGGFYGDLQFGWKVQYGKKGGFFLGVYTDLQRAQLTLTEVVSDKPYTSKAYRSLYGFGAKTSIYF